MRVNKEKHLPPSREVRLEAGIFQGDTEQIAFDIYTGDAGTLANSMVKLELVVELQKSKAVEAFGRLLKRKLIADGYIVVSDIDEGIAQFHEEELLGPRVFEDGE